MYDPNNLFPGYDPNLLMGGMGSQYPDDPFLEDDWKPDRKEALRQAALQAGLSLLGSAPSGQWANFAPAIGAGAQGFAASSAQQKDEAARRRGFEYKLGQEQQGNRERELAKRREAWEKVVGKKEQVSDHRKKVEALPPEYRPLLEPFIGENNFEENQVRVLREIRRAEAERREAAEKARRRAGKKPAGPKPEVYKDYALIPDPGSPSGYRLVPHPRAEEDEEVAAPPPEDEVFKDPSFRRTAEGVVLVGDSDAEERPRGSKGGPTTSALPGKLVELRGQLGAAGVLNADQYVQAARKGLEAGLSEEEVMTQLAEALAARGVLVPGLQPAASPTFDLSHIRGR